MDNILKVENLTNLVNEVYNVAVNNPEGFTLNISNMQLIKSGFVAAYKETQNSFGLDGLKNAIKYALSVGSNIVGGWYNSQNGLYYFDSSKVFDNLPEAALFGLENEQLAIFNLNECKEIKLS